MLIKALSALMVLPGVVVGVIPAILIAVDPWRSDDTLWGLVPLGAGAAILLRCVWDFYRTGNGTLATWAPPKRLVTIGLYKYTRNPMYIGVLLIVAGESILFTTPILAAYWVIIAVCFHLHTVMREEPWLKMQFSEEWQVYSGHVPRWIPRLTRPFRNPFLAI